MIFDWNGLDFHVEWSFMELPWVICSPASKILFIYSSRKMIMGLTGICRRIC